MENKARLSSEAYTALEAIVGSENVTDDPAVLESYSFIWANELFFGDRFAPFRPLAVILPNNTKEIQAIVKTCNKFKIKFKAHSTGFNPAALTANEPYLVIDLRKLNRILFIDEKNMIALVEPYVSHGELFFECIKRGLRFNALGAGPSASVVASSCCFDGIGFHSISAHFDGQNVLGAEWVLPNGELIRLGSMATDSGWFTADGPGLNLRAILRGRYGPCGGLGIITKLAVKLAPWYGPPKLNLKGNPPLYELEIPENFRLYAITFASTKELIEFLRLVEEEQIALCAYKIMCGSTTFVQVTTDSNEEALKKINLKKDIVKKFGNAVLLLMDAASAKEMELKEAYFRKILELTKGEIIPLDKQEESTLFALVLIGVGALRETHRATGGNAMITINCGTYEVCAQIDEKMRPLLLEYAKEGKILFTENESWLVPIAGQWVVIGHGPGYDPTDLESLKAIKELRDLYAKHAFEKKLCIPADGGKELGESTKSMESSLLNYRKYIHMIKKALDPNLLSESSFYG